MEDKKVYRFRLKGTSETFDAPGHTAAEAMERCRRETKWPVSKIVYLGQIGAFKYC